LQNVLVQFLSLGAHETGSRAVGQTQAVAFNEAVAYIADLVRGNINQYAIPQLVDFNYPNIHSYPKLKVRRLNQGADWRAFSVALRNVVEPGVVTPDADLESFVRHVMDLPMPSDEALMRGPDERSKKPQVSPEAQQAQQDQLTRQGSRTGGPKD